MNLGCFYANTKAYLLMGLLWCIVQAGWSQERILRKHEVPPAIQQYVKTHYTKVSNIKYYELLDEDTLFVACNFKQGSTRVALRFKNDSLIETEITIGMAAIPQVAQQAIRTHLDSLYPKYRILRVEAVNPNTELLYEITVKTTKDHYYAFFYAKNGKCITQKPLTFKPILTQF